MFDSPYFESLANSVPVQVSYDKVRNIRPDRFEMNGLGMLISLRKKNIEITASNRRRVSSGDQLLQKMDDVLFAYFFIIAKEKENWIPDSPSTAPPS